MYAIFKNDASIILSDKLKNEGSENLFYFNEVNLKDLLTQVENKMMDIILYHHDMVYMWHEFKKNFKVIEAAGGIVKNAEDKVLFIFRNNRWDLPKGKIEANERVVDAAVREVEEECGIADVAIGDFITKTYHIYKENACDVLKISHWYFMKSNADKLIPQLEEGITEVVWKDKEEADQALLHTYPNIKLLFEISNQRA